MTQETKHTPTPFIKPMVGWSDKWSVDGAKVVRYMPYAGANLVIADCSYEATHGDNHEANAAFIVRACNAHDGLVDALIAVRSTVHFAAMSEPLQTQISNALTKAQEA